MRFLCAASDSRQGGFTEGLNLFVLRWPGGRSSVRTPRNEVGLWQCAIVLFFLHRPAQATEASEMVLFSSRRRRCPGSGVDVRLALAALSLRTLPPLTHVC